MRTVYGQAQHLKPHGHPASAVIEHRDGMWVLTCCGLKASSLEGLGKFTCGQQAPTSSEEAA